MTCKDRSYGARPLRRAIQRYIEDPLSEELIRGHLQGGEIEVYMDAGALAYRALDADGTVAAPGRASGLPAVLEAASRALRHGCVPVAWGPRTGHAGRYACAFWPLGGVRAHVPRGAAARITDAC